MLALLNLAERRGVRVLHGHLDGRNGVYYHELGMVILDQGLCGSAELFTLAHELGHAHFGHLDSSTANEMKADEHAAHLLIDHEQYARAEGISDSHSFIAQELGLPLRAIEAYCRSLAKK